MTDGTEPTAAEQTALKLTFAGWYEDEDFTGSKVTAIPATATGAKTFYAKWTATVTFKEYKAITKYPNPPAVGTAQTVVYGKKANRPSTDPTTSRSDDGFSDFLGWQTDGDTDPVDFDFDTEITKDITIYGKWKGPYTDFEGTAEEFLAAAFIQGNTAATAYNVKITEATQYQIYQIGQAIGHRDSILWKGGVYMKLDLSECGATTIKKESFYYHSSFSAHKLADYLVDITLPVTLEEIGEAAFKVYSYSGSNRWSSLVLPPTLKKIGDTAFGSNKIISSITIPSSVNYIVSNAFSQFEGSITIEDPTGWTCHNNNNGTETSVETLTATMIKDGSGSATYYYKN